MQQRQRVGLQISGAAVLVLCVWKILFLLLGSGSSSHKEEECRRNKDEDASLVRLQNPRLDDDARGWLLDPLKAAAKLGLSAGATECRSVHAGEIRSGQVRANHRHHFCNETFILWNAKAVYRVEKKKTTKSKAGEFVEVLLEADDVAISTASSGQAHAIVNIDRRNSLFLLACQDATFNPLDPNTDFNVWDKRQLLASCADESINE